MSTEEDDAFYAFYEHAEPCGTCGGGTGRHCAAGAKLYRKLTKIKARGLVGELRRCAVTLRDAAAMFNAGEHVEGRGLVLFVARTLNQIILTTPKTIEGAKTK